MLSFLESTKVFHPKFPCPLCGGTRAYHYLLEGRIIEAMKSNFFAVFYVVYIGFNIILLSISSVFQEKFKKYIFVNLFIFIFLLITQWIINIITLKN